MAARRADLGHRDAGRGRLQLHPPRARARRPIARTPAVALTAYGRVEDRLRTLSAGYSIHVPKPADPVELVTVVASLAGRV
jgi:CheY-like chemotaxis protein